MQLTDVPDIPEVVHPDDMDDNDFVRHFNQRHSDQLGGLDGIILRDEYTIELYRKFHDSLHFWHLPSQMQHPHVHDE
jgi:hypothetical protein